MKNRLNSNCMWNALVVSSTLMLAGCTEPRTEAGPVQPTPVVGQVAESNESGDSLRARLLEEQWGIRIERAMLSAGGYMIDFRFRVLDAVKARPLLERQVKPYLIDQASGATFAVPAPPKIGQLRSGVSIQEGKVYFILFANPARYIQSGSKVTVVVGDFRACDVTIL